MLKIRKFYNAKNLFFKKTAFRSLKIFGIIDFLKFCTKLAYVVCDIIQGKKLGVTVLFLSTQHNTTFLSKFYTRVLP